METREQSVRVTLIDGRRIVTSWIFPPIPTRRFDWSATLEDYEPGAPMGCGATEDLAIVDLMSQVDG